MNAKRFGERLALAGLLTMLAAANASAGPYFGEWDWLWHPSCDCQRGAYSPLHYWAPSAYQLRAQIHRNNLDQYPPGPTPAVPPTYEREVYRCPSTPAAPSSPYGDPEAYYGRPLVPTQR